MALQMFLLIGATSFLSAPQAALAWAPAELDQRSSTTTRKGFMVHFLGAAITMGTSNPANAVDNMATDSFGEMFKGSLKASTDDRPPITIPSDIGRGSGSAFAISKSASRKLPSPTTVQVLLQLANPQIRPIASDILVVQIYGDPSRDRLLAGAKIPIAKIRFPISLSMNAQNAMIPKDDWDRLASSRDMYVVASTCPETSSINPQALCIADNSYSLQAIGISKLLTQLPGLDAATVEANGGIRAPASLSLMIK